DRSKKYPLYFLLHGGPHLGVTDGFAWRWNTQVFAGWGYVVAWHNFHGSSGFGEAFTASIDPDWVTKPYRRTIAAAEWFARQPWIDSTRMAAAAGATEAIWRACCSGGRTRSKRWWFTRACPIATPNTGRTTVGAKSAPPNSGRTRLLSAKCLQTFQRQASRRRP